jgi:small subunit ribosomal protein S17e
MGRVRTKLVKKAARVIIEKYYPKLTLDFDTNKKIAEEVAVIPSKRLRNKIAGFITHLMKRIQRGGSVRGISLKLQEEERERRLDYVPEKSILDVEQVEVDPDSHDMLKSLDFGDLPGVIVQEAAAHVPFVRRERRQGGGGGGGNKGPRPAKPADAPKP